MLKILQGNTTFCKMRKKWLQETIKCCKSIVKEHENGRPLSFRGSSIESAGFVIFQTTKLMDRIYQLCSLKNRF